MMFSEFATSLSRDAEKAKKIDERHPDCGCECITASPHSELGPVANEELLWRIILTPVHIDQKTGSVKESAFDDASNKGLSVQRHRLISGDGELRAKGEHLASQKAGRSFALACGAEAGKIRALRVEEAGQSGRFCIYDTAMPDDPGHADVCQTSGGTKRARQELRRKLQKLFLEVVFP